MYGCSMDQRLMLPPRREAGLVVSIRSALKACSLDRHPAADAGVRPSIGIADNDHRSPQFTRPAIREVHHEFMVAWLMEHGPGVVGDLDEVALPGDLQHGSGRGTRTKDAMVRIRTRND